MTLPPVNFGAAGSGYLQFIYRVSTTIPASATKNETLQLNNDSYFELFRFSASSNRQASTDYSPNTFEVKIQVQSQNLSNDLIPQRILCGADNMDNWFGRGLRFLPQTVFNFEFLDTSGLENSLDFCLLGFKVPLIGVA